MASVEWNQRRATSLLGSSSCPQSFLDISRPDPSDHSLAPVDVISVQPRMSTRAGEKPERERHHKIPKPTPHRADGLAAPDARRIGDHALDAPAPQPFIGSQRVRDVIAVSEAFRQDDGILDGHGYTLAGA